MVNQQFLPSLTSRKSSKRSPRCDTLTWIIFLISGCCISFYAGVWFGWNISRNGNDDTQSPPDCPETSPPDCAEICLAALIGGAGELSRKLDGKLDAILREKIEKALETDCPSNSNQNQGGDASNSSTEKRFPKSMSHFANGLISVNRKDLFATYDFGVPMSGGAENQDILMLYDTRSALPSERGPRGIAHAAEYGGGIPHAGAESATSNCDTMNVIFLKKPDLSRSRICTAIVGGQYQSYHIQKWMRLEGSGTKGKADKDAPLRLTGRMTKADGYDEMLYPNRNNIDIHEEIMTSYLTNIKQIRSELSLILEKIAIDNTVIVSTVNQGQSELLMNFVCSSRSRGFDLENFILFPTDKFSKDLAEGMGIATFYSDKLMASVPTQEAARYGDRTFGHIMLAKVICVQLVVELGYDALFQDVDMIWYKNPLTYFHDKTSAIANFDVYFQDDGNRQERYQPYGANSGFYYIRNNSRSKLLFKTMMYSGDIIFACRSHQQILITLLAEANSLTGLRVKVLNRDGNEFPGGFHYHTRQTYMKDFIGGKIKPHIFHMSWTLNKNDKLKFLRQMGMWYVNDHCIGKGTTDILSGQNPGGDIFGECCSAEPLFTCHYRDKPSIKSCSDSPPQDKHGRSFW